MLLLRIVQTCSGALASEARAPLISSFTSDCEKIAHGCQRVPASAESIAQHALHHSQQLLPEHQKALFVPICLKLTNWSFLSRALQFGRGTRRKWRA